MGERSGDGIEWGLDRVGAGLDSDAPSLNGSSPSPAAKNRRPCLLRRRGRHSSAGAHDSTSSGAGDDFERAWERQELEEAKSTHKNRDWRERFELVESAVLLALVVASAVIGMILLLRGSYHYPLAASSLGGGAFITYRAWRRKKKSS